MAIVLPFYSHNPDNCECGQCQTAHPLNLSLDCFAWPTDRYLCYFGPVPGYPDRNGTCPVVYLPEAVYNGLGSAIQKEMRRMGYDDAFPEHPNVQLI